MDLGQSRLLGRSDKGLDNFDDKIEATSEVELTREVLENANWYNCVRKNSEGDKSLHVKFSLGSIGRIQQSLDDN